jgi:hypothetical protein
MILLAGIGARVWPFVRAKQHAELTIQIDSRARLTGI